MRNLALALLFVVGCSSSHSKGNDEKVLESTAWLDRAPEKESDVIHAWIFPRGEGVYFTGNAYKGSYETFRYFVEDGRIKIRFLSDDTKHEMKFKIERIDDRVFDYKLTLDRSPRGPQVYYGFDNHKQRALPKIVRSVLSRIPAY
jgi:hypothetical protein